MKHIHCLQSTPELQDFDVDNPEIQAEFNLMKEQSSNRVEDQVRTILYFVCPSDPDEELNAIDEGTT